MSMNRWFRKPRRRRDVEALDLKNLELLTKPSSSRTIEVQLRHLGPRKIYVANPGQVSYFRAADKAIHSLSR